MSRRVLGRDIGFLFLVALGVWACGATSSDSSRTADTTAASDADQGNPAGELDAELVGAWRGYWSPKGCVRTESHLLFSDGSWKWQATYPEAERGSDRIAERSGSWSKRGNVLVLVEQGYRELLGCRDDSTGSAAADDGGASSSCGEPRYRDVLHPSPVVKELILGECPPNREAEDMDSGYLCRSMGGQAFWRRPIAEEEPATPADE